MAGQADSSGASGGSSGKVAATCCH